MGTTSSKINKIPFRVSARTARLIGRENIATSKGAIIELVKNAYDADSPISLVYFDNKFTAVKHEISKELFETYTSNGIKEGELLLFYKWNKDEEVYTLKKESNKETEAEKKVKTLINKKIKKLNSLYIIDLGEGMTQEIIRNQWMTIGTDNKANNIFTKSGRVKAGAKGIGRFALDKLGGKCEMTTIFNPDNHSADTDENGKKTSNIGYYWNVNWEDFEGEFKTIDKVEAELIGIEKFDLLKELKQLLPNFEFDKIAKNNELVENAFKYGTILKISNLRDNWEDYYVNQVYTDLEVLVPPKETGNFSIHLLSSLETNKYGEVLGSICDDYDYKLVAKADKDQNVSITVYRNEYDVDLMPTDLFKRERFSKSPYLKSDFERGYWTKTLTFSQLLVGFRDVDKDNILENIGIFEFSFYFMKRAYSTPDVKRFFYRKFQANYRKDWLNKFGGIKLFRDNFRVRPYGEVSDVAFDWLGLGNRKATSPAGVAKEGRGYRVEPENIAGAISISRLTNVDFEDKSSREGLQDNKTFQVFKRLLAAIINVFEYDRSLIAQGLKEYDDFKFGAERDSQRASALAKKIIAESKKQKKEQEGSSQDSSNNEEPNDFSLNEAEKILLANEIEKKEKEIETLKSEQKILRALASSGIVMASFSHDLSKLNDVLNSRTDKLKKLILAKISLNDYNDIEERKNPFYQIERIKNQDIKLQNWLKFSLGATRKDKRKRKQLNLTSYFDAFKYDWSTVLKSRGIIFEFENEANSSLRVFEIDVDSIFNNLLVNSIDAFTRLTVSRERKIFVTIRQTDKELIIDYKDTGTGLSEDIDNPHIIFEPLFTTRRNPHTGDEEGTGLGMWLVKTIVEENDGEIALLFPNEGFGLRLTFPIKYKRE